MVATRSSESATDRANGLPVTQGEGGYKQTIRVQQSRSGKRVYTSTSPELPTTRLNTTPSSTGGMEDISLTSSSIGESVIQEKFKTPKRKRDLLMPERTVSSALRRLVAKSSTSKGSAENPIVLEEYSPRRKPIPLSSRADPEQMPHKFKNRHRKLYTYRPDREPLAPKPANGSTFTGDKGGDLYRMMNAKVTSVNWKPPVIYGNVNYGVPFEVQYPMSAQYISQQQQPNPTPILAQQYDSPYVRYHNSMGVTLSGDSEDMLRKKALQHIRDSSRPQHLKKILSDDPDETSTDDSTPVPPPTTLSSPTNTTAVKSRKLQVYQDPNDHITPLVAQTSLLTSLLQVYPKSSDQLGLREDISMLVSVQNKRATEWIKYEQEISRKRRRSNAASISNVKTAAREKRKKEDEERMKDEEMRILMSAGAGMWQDGSGEGVVDVYTSQADKYIRGTVANAAPPRAVRKLGVCGLSPAM
jgi:hypothetical protein